MYIKSKDYLFRVSTALGKVREVWNFWGKSRKFKISEEKSEKCHGKQVLKLVIMMFFTWKNKICVWIEFLYVY